MFHIKVPKQGRAVNTNSRRIICLKFILFIPYLSVGNKYTIIVIYFVLDS